MRRIAAERFDELVAEALDAIPDWIADHMDNVAVFTEGWPCGRGDSGSDDAVLGLYEGIELTARTPLSYDGVMPDRIILYREPLTQIAADEADLRRQIRVTIVHEVGHHFGLDDDRLAQLGWE